MIIIHLQICLLFYCHKKCTNLICDVPLNLTQSNKKRGFSGEREGEGRRGGRGEGRERRRREGMTFLVSTDSHLPPSKRLLREDRGGPLPCRILHNKTKDDQPLAGQ